MTQHNHANAPIDLDALAWDYLPRRHNEGDDRVLALIQRLRKLERVREAANDLDYGKGSDALTAALQEIE